MAKYFDVQQGEQEWLDARAGIPTTSEFANLVTPAWKVRTAKDIETYLHKKLAERMGYTVSVFFSGPMEQGSILEDTARPWYAFAHNRDVAACGFFTTDDGSAGCSPDGIFGPPEDIAECGGIEIKCPQPHAHFGYLLANEVPAKYRAQVQGAMYVTGAKKWTFVSYLGDGFVNGKTVPVPKLVLTVPRDEVAMSALGEALAAFNKRLDAGFEQLNVGKWS